MLVAITTRKRREHFNVGPDSAVCLAVSALRLCPGPMLPCGCRYFGGGVFVAAACAGAEAGEGGLAADGAGQCKPGLTRRVRRGLKSCVCGGVSTASGICPVADSRTAQPWPTELPSGGQVFCAGWYEDVATGGLGSRGRAHRSPLAASGRDLGEMLYQIIQT